MCPRVVILREGRLAADGTQEQLVAELGGAGHVAFEAVVGDPVAAQGLLESLPGVSEVTLGERVGIHQAFTIHGEGDLREDVGALAMTQGWAARELSWERPNLEQLFARLVLGTGELAAREGAPVRPVAGPATPVVPVVPQELALAPEAPGGAPSAAPALGEVGEKDVFYSLNPFDQGGARDLTAPMKAEDAAPTDDDADCEEGRS